jgi:hypothetical protein
MANDPEKIYSDGYAAFERGDFDTAIDLAGQCLGAADNDSYWYAGALGLRIWATSFSGDVHRMTLDANALLSLDSGDHKMWFDGLALTNLAIELRKTGDIGEAELNFSQASAKYVMYRVADDQPADYRYIVDLFAAVNHWAATDSPEMVQALADRMAAAKNLTGDAAGVKRAVDIYLKMAGGETVTKLAEDAVAEGVSRTFLALPLLLSASVAAK